MMDSFRDGFPDGMNMLSFIPDSAQKAMPEETLNTLAQVKNADDLQDIIDKMDAASKSMKGVKEQIDNAIAMMANFPDGKIPGGKTLIDFIPEQAKAQLKNALTMLKSLAKGKIPDGMNFVDFIPAGILQRISR